MKKLLSESIVEINKFYNFLKDKNKRKTISDKGFIAYKKVTKYINQEYN